MKKELLYMSFGDLLSNARKLKSWTIKDFIEKLEKAGQKSVSPAYITRIEQYGEIPSPDLILILADILSLDKRKLLDCAKQTKIKKFDKNLDDKYLKALTNYENKGESKGG